MDLSHVRTSHANQPFPKGAQVLTSDCPADHERLQKPYRELLGVVSFCAHTTRPDISWHVSQLGRVQSNPGQQHWDLALHLLRYLIHTKELGICYTPSHSELEVYSDASWGDIPPKYIQEQNLYRRVPISTAKAIPAISNAALPSGVPSHTYSGSSEQFKYIPIKGAKWIDPKDPDGRRSSFGYLSVLSNAPISWQSQIQKGRRALSTTESELYAATHAAKDLIHVRSTIQPMGYSCTDPIVIHEDNQSTINQVLRQGITARNKHVELRWYYLRDLESEGITSIKYCPTDMQLADILTKNLPSETFFNIRNKIISSPPTILSDVE